MNHIKNTRFLFFFVLIPFADQCLKCYIDFSALGHNKNIIKAEMIPQIRPMVLTSLFVLSLVILMRNIYINLNL